MSSALLDDRAQPDVSKVLSLRLRKSVLVFLLLRQLEALPARWCEHSDRNYSQGERSAEVLGETLPVLMIPVQALYAMSKQLHLGHVNLLAHGVALVQPNLHLMQHLHMARPSPLLQ